MTMPHIKNSVKESKKCISCKSTIPNDAIKCPFCGTYQTLSKRITSSMPLLAGFVLTSLSIVTAIPIKNIIEKQEPVIKIAIVRSDAHEITFMVTNSGNQVAGVSKIEINNNMPSGSYSSYYLKEGIDNGLLDAGKGYIIKAGNGEPIPHAVDPVFMQSLPESIKSHIGSPCSLSLDYVQIDGTYHNVSLPFTCLPA